MNPFDDLRMRWIALVPALALLLLPVGTMLAEAETPAPDPATQTDLCAHEHTISIIYFDDAPQYTAISATHHRVQGPGVVEVICEDCGKLLSAEYLNNAEELHTHTIRNGRCALCGYRLPVAGDETIQEEEVFGEMVLGALRDQEKSDIWRLSVSADDLDAMLRLGVETALIRGENMETAFAFSVTPLANLLKTRKEPLEVTMEARDDGSFFISAGFVAEADSQGEPSQADVPASEICFLRFYRSENPSITLLWTSPENDLRELALTWTPPTQEIAGYWSIPWPGTGNYMLKEDNE